MSKTAAERQAERRERVQKTIDDLSASNLALVADLRAERDTNQALRAELEAFKSRAAATELSELKAQVKNLKKIAQKPVKTATQAS